MATLTRVEPGHTGADPLYVTPTATTGDDFPIDDDTVLHVRNGSGSSINVTITSVVPAEPGLVAANLVVAVPAGANRDIRPRPSVRFRAANGRATAVCSAVTTVQVAVTRVA
jgi:hypothetical protein